MLDNLTNQQKIILDDYMAVTATQDIQVAVDSLSRHGWDLSVSFVVDTTLTSNFPHEPFTVN